MRTSVAVLCTSTARRLVVFGHAVEVAADRDHAVAGDAALEAQHGLERPGRERLQARPLLGEVLGDDAVRGGVGADVGDLVEPLAELLVEIVEVAEAAAEEEVLADVAERPLYLALIRHDGLRRPDVPLSPVERRYGETIRDMGRREHVSAGRPTLKPWAASPSLYLAAPAARPDALRARIRSCRVARRLP